MSIYAIYAIYTSIYAQVFRFSKDTLSQLFSKGHRGIVRVFADIGGTRVSSRSNAVTGGERLSLSFFYLPCVPVTCSLYRCRGGNSDRPCVRRCARAHSTSLSVARCMVNGHRGARGRDTARRRLVSRHTYIHTHSIPCILCAHCSAKSAELTGDVALLDLAINPPGRRRRAAKPPRPSSLSSTLTVVARIGAVTTSFCRRRE